MRAALFALVACCLQPVLSFFVTVPTGFVGVRVTFGKVVAPLLMPGLSYYNPLSTRIEVVEVRPQSDGVSDIDCITNEGLKLSFERIEIGNMLATESVISTVEKFGPLYDRFLVLDLVRHQVNVICSQKSFHQLAISEFEQLDDELRAFIQQENDRQQTGLQVLFVRLTKPKMPPSIESNYLALAEGTATVLLCNVLLGYCCCAEGPAGIYMSHIGPHQFIPLTL